MVYRSITRLLHHTPPESKQFLALCHIFHGNRNDVIYAKHCHIFNRLKHVHSLAGKKSATKDKDDSNSDKKRPQSILAQKMFNSEQNRLEPSKQEINRRLKSMKDLHSKVEGISNETNSIDENEYIDDTSSEADNFRNVKTSLFEQSGAEEDFIENIFLKQDLHLQSKPSPLLGTEDRAVPVSKAPCVGCGALLHCQHRTMPGFLPSERFKLLSESELRSSICQRCHYIQHCDAFVEVTSSASDYAQIISQIKQTRSVVVMVIDVTDIQGSIIPNLATYIGHKHPLVIVGNKVDLIAPDSTQYLIPLKEAIMQSCNEAGLGNIRKVMLISAKTGFGIERLISHLFKFYRMKVDVFIVGTANAGKSSLFNTLLASDYCRHRARDLIQRATVSVWPGTTLNLLKFPIMNPTPRTLALRHNRLKQETAIKKEEQRLRRIKEKKKKETWELKEEVNTTDTWTQKQLDKSNSDSPWGQEVFAYKGGQDGSISSSSGMTPETFDPAQYEHCYWVYDTPGVINPGQTFNLLEPDECPLLQPAEPMTPRCVVLKPGTSVFISGMARLDYVQGNEDMMTVVHSSSKIPIRVVSLEEADDFYLQHAGTQELGIPVGDRNRLDRLPSLVGKEFTLEGESDNIAVADIQLSSIGWISMAPKPGCKVKVTAYTPSRKGIHVRCPSLLPRFLQFKGKWIRGTPFFWPRRFGLPVAGRELTVEDDKV